jgi:hypothetical protein
MKNIHILPTDRPSRLYAKDGNYKLANSTMSMDWYISSAGYKPYNIYITSDEVIKEGVNQWYLDKFLNKPMNSGGAQYGEKQNVIILTTDPTLIKDGVQAIDDEFLEWFVKNPNCEFVEVQDWVNYYKIFIPQEEPKQNQDPCNLCGKTLREQMKGCYEITCYRQFLNKQETLKEVAERLAPNSSWRLGFIAGANYMAERMYSEEEVRKIAEWSFHFYKTNEFDDSELEEEWNRLLKEKLKKK